MELIYIGQTNVNIDIVVNHGQQNIVTAIKCLWKNLKACITNILAVWSLNAITLLPI